MISSLEHRCSCVEAGPGRYFMKNGVNRCGTNRTQRTGRIRGKGVRGRAKKSGRAAGYPAQLTMSFYLACEETLLRVPDVKCMYNLQTENYFNCGAKHPAASINQSRLRATRRKEDRLTCYSSPYFFREYRVVASSLIETHSSCRRICRALLFSAILAARDR